MKSLDPPEFLHFWVLFSQSSTSLYFSTTGTAMTSGAPSYGTGFYASLDEAEKARTFSILNDKTGNQYHIFELEFPNPAYRDG